MPVPQIPLVRVSKRTTKETQKNKVKYHTASSVVTPHSSAYTDITHTTRNSACISSARCHSSFSVTRLVYCTPPLPLVITCERQKAGLRARRVSIQTRGRRFVGRPWAGVRGVQLGGHSEAGGARALSTCHMNMTRRAHTIPHARTTPHPPHTPCTYHAHATRHTHGSAYTRHVYPMHARTP